MEVADFYIEQGYGITLVLRLVKIPRSSYYYHKNGKVAQKKVCEGRPAPGYSYQESGVRIADEQIEEWLMKLQM